MEDINNMLTSSADQEISQLKSKKTAVEKLDGDTQLGLFDEMKKIITLENKLIQKEKEINYHLEEARRWTNRANSLQEENSQLLSEKTALEKLNDDIRVQFAKEKSRISTLENNLTLSWNEKLHLKEEIDKQKNEAKHFEKDLSSSQKEISQLLSEKQTLVKQNGDIRDKLTELKTAMSTLENKLTQKEKETIQKIEEIDMWKN